MRFPLLAALALTLLPASSFAFDGSIDFTPAERTRHELNQDLILKTSADCAKAIFDRHTAFYKKYGISPYYGEGSSFASKSEWSQRQYLKRQGLDPDLLDQLEPSSCVGYVMNCLGKGFAAAGQDDLWQRIRAFTKLNGVGGLALQEGLRKLGWKILFWLPDERRNNVRAIYEEREDPTNSTRFWGYHAERLKEVRDHATYLGLPVDDAKLLVNFGPQVPEALKSMPFFVGTAHGAYHVFAGAFGYVLEAHSSVEIDDPKSVDYSPFNPMNSQGPTEGMLFSGLIAVPAKYVH